MKKISKWSIAGMVFGGLFVAGSFVRYYFLWPDLDRAIVYPLIGLCVFAISWLYSQNLEQNNTIEALEEYIVDKENCR